MSDIVDGALGTGQGLKETARVNLEFVAIGRGRLFPGRAGSRTICDERSQYR